jgi:hypothetical protein
MKKSLLFSVILIVLLASCSGPTDKEIGQAILLVTPTVFLISVGLQYLFFRLWQRKWPELRMSWLPNLIFYIFLNIVAGIWGNGNPFWFFTDASGLSGYFILFGSSYLTVLFIITRIWLAINPARVFTWASIIALSLFALPALPMIAGMTEGTQILYLCILPVWVYPGSVLFSGLNADRPGALTALVLFILLAEVWFRTEKKLVSRAGKPHIYSGCRKLRISDNLCP